VGAVLRQRASASGKHANHSQERGRGVPPEAARPRRGGAPIPPRIDKILYDELAADLTFHYQTTGRRNASDVVKRLRPLGAFFGGRRAVDLDESAITRYVAARQATPSRRGGPLANGTINRELSLLGTMFRLAARRKKVLHPPTITLLEAAPRAGFFEPDQFAAVRRHLGPDLQLAVDLD
jgi:hypothetical protein